MVANQTIWASRGVILIAKGVTLTGSFIQRLQKFKIQAISVQTTEEEKPPTCSLVTPAAEKAIAASETLLESMSEHKTVNVEKNSFKIVQTIYSIWEKPFIQQCLEDEAQNEELYHHSLRTTLLTLNMGLAKGYDFINLEYLAMSALLHDSGMGREFNEENTDHSFLGFMKLRDNHLEWLWAHCLHSQ